MAIQGLQLALMIGQGTPSSVPRAVVDALSEARVITASNGPSGFQLTFAASAGSALNSMFMLSGGSVPPMVRVVLVAVIGGSAEVLMDGVMTRHEAAPGAAESGGGLTITGEDLSRVMDYADSSGTAYPATSPEARVSLILGKYASLGVMPKIVSSGVNDVPTANDFIPRHQGRDLGYLRQLAEQAGHVFYLEPGPTPGSSIAYWGPELRAEAPQPALSVNFGPRTNVQSLSFSFDPESAAKPAAFTQDPQSKEAQEVSVGDTSSLSPRLAAVAPLRKRDVLRSETSKLSPGWAAQHAKAQAARTEQSVTASGTLDVLQYGRVLKARRLVGVRGAGEAFDGLYHVRSVTHRITRGQYLQDFTLVRNGLKSTVNSLVV